MQRQYAGRGVNLVRLAGRWMFRTSPDMAWLLASEEQEKRKMSRAAIETLAIIAYHQPVTRADIENIRGVSRLEGRDRRAAGGGLDPAARPAQSARATHHLRHDVRLSDPFRARPITDLPGVEELKGAGMFDGKLPQGFGVPKPDDSDALRPDEEPLGDVALEEAWSALPGEDGDEA